MGTIKKNYFAYPEILSESINFIYNKCVIVKRKNVDGKYVKDEKFDNCKLEENREKINALLDDYEGSDYIDSVSAYDIIRLIRMGSAIGEEEKVIALSNRYFQYLETFDLPVEPRDMVELQAIKMEPDKASTKKENNTGTVLPFKQK